MESLTFHGWILPTSSITKFHKNLKTSCLTMQSRVAYKVSRNLLISMTFIFSLLCLLWVGNTYLNFTKINPGRVEIFLMYEKRSCKWQFSYKTKVYKQTSCYKSEVKSSSKRYLLKCHTYCDRSTLH